MKNGVMASLSEVIDFDTAAIIAEEMGCKVEKEVVVTIEEKLNRRPSGCRRGSDFPRSRGGGHGSR